MPVTNNIKKQVDLPVWEWVRFVPNTNNVPTSAMTAADDGSSRYIYHMYNAQLWRYDTVSDMWHYLTPCPITPSTVLALKYSKHAGNRARVLGTNGTNKITSQYFAGGNALVGTNLEIVSGVGANQVRTITAVSDEIINDSGLATAASTSLITDTTKNWKINQWVGYTCRVTFGIGWSTQRTIIYNTTNTLYFYDSSYGPYEPFDNMPFGAALAPTAGSQPHFTILSQELTVNSNFTVAPNTNSRFLVETGVIWMITSFTGSFYFYMYDILNDFWVQKTNGAFSVLPAALGTDVVLERTGKITGVLLSGTGTSGAIRTLTDTTKSMPIDKYANYQIRITGGTGMGQRRRIQSNGTNYFEVAKKWDVIPNATSTYEIYPSTENIYMMGNGNAAMFVYNTEADLWSQGQLYDYGVTCNIVALKDNHTEFGISTGVRNTGGILTVAINAAGLNYKIGDIITISGGGGTNGKVQVETISSTGAVTSVSLMRPGATYSVTTGAAVTGGSGSGLTINILTVGVVGYITTSLSHQFKIGDTITIAGCSEAAWNGSVTIIGSDASNTFDIATTATANMSPSFSQTVNLIVDAAANWDVNEHVGKLVCTQLAGPNGTAQWRRIASNTATTLTVTLAITLPVTGTTRYLIQDAAAFGGDNQFQIKNQWGTGAATSGSTTTIVDNTKNWLPNSWTNYKVRIVAGTGIGSELTITGNDATTLTFAAQAFTVDTTTRYRIMDVYGACTATGATTTIIDSTKNWKVNQWAGKRVRITAGTNYTTEVSIVSNTSNTLTLGAAMAAASDVSTTYTILGIYNISTGISLSWLFANNMERYMVNFRGGASGGVNIYDIVSDTWEYNIFYYPQAETFTTGTMYAFDGDNRIYIINGGRVMYYDVARREMVSSGSPAYGMGTAQLGNRMEIIETEDGLKFLYVMRHGANEFWRTLLFW